MELNADFDKRVMVHSEQLDWNASPMPGVDRRMLDRIGGEVARATTIVRYAPGSKFSEHTHTGGEEFIVLDGVFQDEHGVFPKAPMCAIHPPLRIRLDRHQAVRSSLNCGSSTWMTAISFAKLWRMNLARQ